MNTAKFTEAATAADEFLSVEDILQADDNEFIDVPMPEWKRKDGSIGKVRIRTLTNLELMEYGEELNGNPELKKMGNLALVMRSAIKPDGTRLFSLAQLEQLKHKSSKGYNRLAKAATKLNGVGDDTEVTAAKNV